MPLRQKVLLGMTGVVVAFVAIAVLVMALFLGRVAESQVDRRVREGRLAWEQFRAVDERLLLDRALAAASAPHLVATLAIPGLDAATAAVAAESAASATDASLLVLLDASGLMLAAAGPDAGKASGIEKALDLERTTRDGPYVAWPRLGGGLVRAAVVPVLAGQRLNGYLVMGRAADAAFEKGIADVAGLHARIFDSRRGPDIKELPAISRDESIKSSVVELDGDRVRLLLYMPVDEITRQYASTYQLLLALGAATIVLSVAVSGMLSRRLTRSLAELTAASERYARGELDYEVRPRGHDEVARLTESFNDMARRIAQSQEQLVKTARLASVGELAAGVAHEINNPTAVIKLSAEQLQAGVCASPEEQADALGDIVGAADRIGRITRSLLRFARQEDAPFVPVPVRELVDGATGLVGMFVEKAGVRLDIELPEGLPKVRCRPEQVQQVLVNLLNNARDALASKGAADRRITVSARPIDGAASRRVQLEVEDNGPGIPSEVLPRIFDPFFTTKPRTEGTGLGLSISYSIVRDHGGELMVDSAAGRGTCFRFSLGVDGSA